MAGYGSDDEFQAYATAAGYTLPDGGNITAARQRGSVYIDGSYEPFFPGVPTDPVQERSWPRTGAVDRYGRSLDPDAVPQRVINASYEAAYLELQEPGSLSATISGNERIKTLKAGSVEIDYADSTSTDAISGAIPKATVIEGILAPLLQPILPAALVV